MSLNKEIFNTDTFAIQKQKLLQRLSVESCEAHVVQTNNKTHVPITVQMPCRRRRSLWRLVGGGAEKHSSVHTEDPTDIKMYIFSYS